MRRSFSRPRREGTACRGGSVLLARTTYTAPASVRAKKTITPAHVPITRAAIAIAAKNPTVRTKKGEASASLRRGVILPLEDVHRRVHDNPHYVDEVPVDPRNLHAAVLRGREMASEGANRREREDRQPHDHVSAVQPRQAVERGPERAVLWREAGPRILTDLRQQEREAEGDREYEACLHPGSVAPFDRLERPVHREARRDQDPRVDPRAENRQGERRGRPLGGAGHDPREEVDREERAEEHDLRRDEEQHSERRGVHPRALVRNRRPVLGFGGRGHSRAPPPGPA